MYQLLSIAIGSILGGWLRWWTGLKLNSLFPQIPPGTVVVNLVGGFIIGFAISYLANSNLHPNYRLFWVTGFCGGLTTFSTFSMEIVTLLQNDRPQFALLAISIHLIGSVVCTGLGIASYHWIAAH